MSRKLKMDFTDVESFIKCAEGEHIAVLREIEEKVATTGSDMLSVKFEVTKGSSTGAVLYDNFVLTEKALWKLKSYLEVVGMKADGKVMVDLDKLIGKACIIQVKYEEYDGKERSKIDGYKKFEGKVDEEDEEEYEDEEEIEPTPAPKKKKKQSAPAADPTPTRTKTKKKPTPPIEEDDEEDDEEWDEA